MKSDPSGLMTRKHNNTFILQKVVSAVHSLAHEDTGYTLHEAKLLAGVYFGEIIGISFFF